MGLSRVLEREVMDHATEALDYDAMDHQEVNRLFVDHLLEFAAQVGGLQGEVLDMGTGTARIPVELCRRASHCRVVAADLSADMLSIAGINVELAGLTERILLHRADSKSLPYTSGRFDWVISNSLIHHLPEPDGAIREMLRVVQPGGGLFVRDLLRPRSQSELAALVAQYAGNEQEAARAMFADSLHAALELHEIQSLVAACGYPPDSVSQTSDRHWTWRLHRPRETV